MADLHDRVVLLPRADGALAAGIAEGLAEARATLVPGRLPPDPEACAAWTDRVERLGGRVQRIEAPGADGPVAAWRDWDAAVRRQVGPPHAVVLDLEVPGAPAAAGLDDPDSCRRWTLAHLPPRLFRLAAALDACDPPAPVLLLLLPARPPEGPPCFTTGLATAAIEAFVAGTGDGADRAPRLGLQPGALDPAFGADQPLEGRVTPVRPREPERIWAESPRLVGRCVAALLKDPDLRHRHGRVAAVRSLVLAYRLRDLDGAGPGAGAPASGAGPGAAH